MNSIRKTADDTLLYVVAFGSELFSDLNCSKPYVSEYDEQGAKTVTHVDIVAIYPITHGEGLTFVYEVRPK